MEKQWDYVNSVGGGPGSRPPNIASWQFTTGSFFCCCFVLNSTQLITLYILSNHPEYLFNSTFFPTFIFFPQVCGFFFKKRWGSQADKYILWQLAIIQFSIGSSVSCLWGWFKFGSFRKALVPCSFSHNLSRWQESWEESETDRKGSLVRRFSGEKALGNLYDPSSDHHK